MGALNLELLINSSSNIKILQCTKIFNLYCRAVWIDKTMTIP